MGARRAVLGPSALAPSIALALAAALGGNACQPSFDPANYVIGLRVLAVKGDPAETAAGQTATLAALVVDTEGRPIDLGWAACTEPPAPGSGLVNPDCLRNETAPYLLPLGQGPTLSFAVPVLGPAELGLPDSTGGVYLPVRLRARAGSAGVDAVFGLRLASPSSIPENHNPTLSAVSADGAPLDEASALEVAIGQSVTLRAAFAEGSVETYTIAAAGQTRTVSELLRVSWFATAGTFSEGVTGEDKPDTVWKADTHLPARGQTIDLWVVGRDERGGVDWQHRLLRLR